jgi:uncharacterized protein YecT (DUF1311 family)
MRGLPCFTVVVVSIAFAFAVRAADQGKGKSDERCDDGDLGIAGQSLSYDKQYKQADAELNKVYEQVMSRLDSKSQKDALKAAQRAWISFRDKECDFDASRYEGGTLVNVVHPACLYPETARRTDALHDYRKMLDGQ